MQNSSRKRFARMTALLISFLLVAASSSVTPAMAEEISGSAALTQEEAFAAAKRLPFVPDDALLQQAVWSDAQGSGGVWDLLRPLETIQRQRAGAAPDGRQDER